MQERIRNMGEEIIIGNSDLVLKIILLLILIGTIYMITANNILLSCFSLIFIFICGMILSLCLNLWFLGLLILIIYIGAIATLFLFIILMIDLYIKIEQENDFEKTVAMFTICIIMGLIVSFNYDYIFLNENLLNNRTYLDFLRIEEEDISINNQALFVIKDEYKIDNFLAEHMVIESGDVKVINNKIPMELSLEIKNLDKDEVNIFDGNDIIIIGKLLYTHFSVALIFSGISLLIAIISVLVTAEGMALFNFISRTKRVISGEQLIEKKQDSFHQILKLYKIGENEENKQKK